MKEPEILKVSDIYRTLYDMGTLCPLKTQGPPCDLIDKNIRCVCRFLQKGHAKDEYNVLKAKIYDLINNGKISHLYGPRTMLVCDRVEPEVSITSVPAIHHFYFIAFNF